MLICVCELQYLCLVLFQFSPSWVLLLILNGHKVGQPTVCPGTHLVLGNLGRPSGLSWQSQITQVIQTQVKTRDKLNWIQIKNQKFRKHNTDSLWDYRNIWGLHFLISTYCNFSTHRKESISILPCLAQFLIKTNFQTPDFDVRKNVYIYFLFYCREWERILGINIWTSRLLLLLDGGMEAQRDWALTDPSTQKPSKSPKLLSGARNSDSLSTAEMIKQWCQPW